MKHSDFSLIPIFVAIVEELNYTKAASQLGISQSAVSQSVTKLREIYGDQLFIRKNNGVEPTQFALDMYPALAKAVKEIVYAHPKHKAFDPSSCEETFILASLSIFGHDLLPQLFKLIRLQAPKVKVQVVPLIKEDMVHELRIQQCDLIIDTYIGSGAELNSKAILESPVCVICNPDHPRVTGKSISESEFLNEQHIGHSQFSTKDNFFMGIDESVRQTLENRDFVWKVGSASEMLPIISGSEYIGLMPKFIAKQHMESYRLKAVDVDFLQVPLTVAMSWHSSRQTSPAHRWFRNQVEIAAKRVQDRDDAEGRR